MKTSEALGRFIAQADDADYNDPKVLQRLILDTYHLSSEGVRTESRWRESQQQPATG